MASSSSWLALIARFLTPACAILIGLSDQCRGVTSASPSQWGTNVQDMAHNRKFARPRPRTRRSRARRRRQSRRHSPKYSRRWAPIGTIRRPGDPAATRCDRLWRGASRGERRSRALRPAGRGGECGRLRKPRPNRRHQHRGLPRADRHQPFRADPLVEGRDPDHARPGLRPHPQLLVCRRTDWVDGPGSLLGREVWGRGLFGSDGDRGGAAGRQGHHLRAWRFSDRLCRLVPDNPQDTPGIRRHRGPSGAVPA
jgi:hypothetical protein